MYRCLMSSVLILVLWGASLNGHTQDFPEGEYKYPPDQSRIIIGPPDFEKLRDFSENSAIYKLSRKVAYIQLGSGGCTGFLVGRDLLLTNHHCVYRISNRQRDKPYEEQVFKQRRLQDFKVYMAYYEDDKKGAISSGVKGLLKADAALDYALLRLKKPLGDTYGWLALSETTPKRGTSVRIIQHPRGRSKEISRKNTEIDRVFDDMLHYAADTEKGSSGSPVFPMQEDKVIALHRAGSVPEQINEGVLMKKIVPEIKNWLPADVSTAPSSATADDKPEGDPSDTVYNFLKTHLIGNTLIHQDYIPMEDGNGETEVTHRQTYTNLTESDDTFAFDMFSVITQSQHQFNQDGMRRQETPSPLQSDVSLIRYTVSKDADTAYLSGDAEYISHTSTELIDSESKLYVRLKANTLTLITAELLAREPTAEGNPFLPEKNVSVQHFWEEGEMFFSRSELKLGIVDPNALEFAVQDVDTAPIIWHVERSTPQAPEPVDMVANTISEREDVLMAEMAKHGTASNFLIAIDTYLYPCQVEGGLLESFPMQADVKTYHHDKSFRVVFYNLLLLNEVEGNIHTLESFENAEWRPVNVFQWDGSQFLGGEDTTSDLKPYTLDQIRFEANTPQSADGEPETDEPEEKLEK